MKKTINHEFYKNIARSQGILETKTFRYVIIDQTTVKRIRLEYIDTTAALPQSGNWEVLEVK